MLEPVRALAWLVPACSLVSGGEPLSMNSDAFSLRFVYNR